MVFEGATEERVPDEPISGVEKGVAVVEKRTVVVEEIATGASIEVESVLESLDSASVFFFFFFFMFGVRERDIQLLGYSWD